MKLTVLGKYGLYPQAGGATSSYIIESGAHIVNLDFGSGALSRTLSATGKLPSAIVFSHLHFDHTSDILPLVYALKSPIDVLLPFDDSPIFELVSGLPMFNAVRITDGLETDIDGLKFKFVRLTHPVESYGMRISDGKSDFFYSGDTVYDDRILTAANGCSLVLLDACATRAAAGKVPHITIEEAKKIRDALNVRVLLSHVLPGYPPYAEAEANGLEVVEELKSYEI